jgi:hypothetical protein
MTYNTEFDYNSADVGGGLFELIPDGTIARVAMTIRPGSVGDGGWLTQSKSSDALYLNSEFVILEGPYNKRKFWANLTVSGGKVDEQGSSIAGNITRATLRAMLESAHNLRPDDETDEAKRKRLVNGYGDFNGLEFFARIGVEPARGEFAAKNRLAGVITPDKAGYGQAPTSQAPGGGGGTTSGGGAGGGTAAPTWAKDQAAAKPKDESVAPAWAS